MNKSRHQLRYVLCNPFGRDNCHTYISNTLELDLLNGDTANVAFKQLSVMVSLSGGHAIN